MLEVMPESETGQVHTEAMESSSLSRHPLELSAGMPSPSSRGSEGMSGEQAGGGASGPAQPTLTGSGGI